MKNSVSRQGIFSTRKITSIFTHVTHIVVDVYLLHMRIVHHTYGLTTYYSNQNVSHGGCLVRLKDKRQADKNTSM